LHVLSLILFLHRRNPFIDFEAAADESEEDGESDDNESDMNDFIVPDDNATSSSEDN